MHRKHQKQFISAWRHSPLQASAQLLRQLAAMCAGALADIAAVAAPHSAIENLGTSHNTGGSSTLAAALHAVMTPLLQATAELTNLIVAQVR